MGLTGRRSLLILAVMFGTLILFSLGFASWHVWDSLRERTLVIRNETRFPVRVEFEPVDICGENVIVEAGSSDKLRSGGLCHSPSMVIESPFVVGGYRYDCKHSSSPLVMTDDGPSCDWTEPRRTPGVPPQVLPEPVSPLQQ